MTPPIHRVDPYSPTGVVTDGSGSNSTRSTVDLAFEHVGKLAEKVEALQQQVTRLTTIIAVVGGTFGIVFSVVAMIFWDIRRDDTELLRETHESAIRLQLVVEQNDRRIDALEYKWEADRD